ncbi:DNA polymerase III subunit delta' [Wolbachia pipientis]|uniref:DNA polymerase III subunit delta n=1 Tax=Wolbachia pipientis TaxID=955 RepID=A0A1E7QLG8_WOLPI|nr:hypothetical protein [Wolbachia pipientis]OEY87186.1 DNA polymerase III subunit delta' [Wolbachia pipientis]
MKQIIGHDKAIKKLIDNMQVQSWIICGKKGIGKATLTKNYQFQEEFDLYVASGNTIGIEQIREMKDFLYLSPIHSEYKVAIVDSLEEMNNNSKNAILKILEEPPKNAKIFIISHRPYDIQATIKCRCFQLNLSPLTYEETKYIVYSKYQINDQVFNTMFNLFSGAPGMIMNAINSNLDKMGNFNEIINNNDVDLGLISRIIQVSILRDIKANPESTEILIDQWSKINKLFTYAKQFHLDKKHVLANIINILPNL